MTTFRPYAGSDRLGWATDCPDEVELNLSDPDRVANLVACIAESIRDAELDEVVMLFTDAIAGERMEVKLTSQSAWRLIREIAQRVEAAAGGEATIKIRGTKE